MKRPSQYRFTMQDLPLSAAPMVSSLMRVILSALAAPPPVGVGGAGGGREAAGDASADGRRTLDRCSGITHQTGSGA